MDDDSTRLTEEERRVLAEMEMGLRRTAPDLERNLRRRTWRRGRHGPSRARRSLWVTALVLGVVLLGAGMLLAAVPVAAAGFVVVLVAIHVLTSDVHAEDVADRFRRWFRLEERPRGGADG